MKIPAFLSESPYLSFSFVGPTIFFTFSFAKASSLTPGRTRGFVKPRGNKKAGAPAYANVPVLHQKADELPIDPAAWIVHHLFNL